MIKPYGRKTKSRVKDILNTQTRKKALESLAQIPDEQLVGHLFSHFYDTSSLVKFRATVAMGELGMRLADRKMESARDLIRRMMWNLNDESGGIGWGSPEAFGETLAKSQELAMEFKSILFSYLDHRGNFIEHPVLQRGVLWGIGTYLEAAPSDITVTVKEQLLYYLHSEDRVKRAYAMRALINANFFHCGNLPEFIFSDTARVDIFAGWHFEEIRICDMSHACEGSQLFA